jgi:3-oxoacyl-(acyl-carrier-protein) synthase
MAARRLLSRVPHRTLEIHVSYRHDALLSVRARAGFTTAQVARPAHASTAPLSDAREVAHFDSGFAGLQRNVLGLLKRGDAGHGGGARGRWGRVVRVETEPSVPTRATCRARLKVTSGA